MTLPEKPIKETRFSIAELFKERRFSIADSNISAVENRHSLIALEYE